MTIAIRKLVVPRQHQKVHSGQIVQVGVEVIDIDVIASFLIPSELPTFSLFDSLGVRRVHNQQMTITDPGFYIGTYQTGVTDILGPYTISVSVQNNDSFAMIDRVVAFRISKLTDFDDFTYLIFKDQSGQVWYYYVLQDGTLEVSQTVPSIFNKIGEAINSVDIYWINIDNDLGQSRYIFPLADGSLDVSTTQPVVGTGVTVSPIFLGVSGLEYRLTLLADDSIDITEV